jgi:uncharacterized protein (DUF433 family)
MVINSPKNDLWYRFSQDKLALMGLGIFGLIILAILLGPLLYQTPMEGTRITVQSVLELLNEGLSFSTIIEDYYPDLQIEDIRACLQYAIALVADEDIKLVSA